MGFFGFAKSEKINASKLSDQIKPIFEIAYAICREFGREEGTYFNYRYKDQIIDIRHSNEGGSEPDAYSTGKHVSVEYKGRCVFDCLIKLNGDIKSKVFETGEWEKYFSALDRTRKVTLLARNMLEKYYSTRNTFFEMARDKKIHVADYRRYSYTDGRFKVNYELEGSYLFSDGVAKIDFVRNEKNNVASAAVITFKGKVVFDAVHFFPSKQRPYSSNTHCKVFENGEWEKYLDNAISSFKALYGA